MSGEAFEYLVRGLRPDVGLGIGVPCGYPGADVLLKDLDTLVDASPYLLVRQLGEPPLDQVEPGRSGRGEVQVKARVGASFDHCKDVTDKIDAASLLGLSDEYRADRGAQSAMAVGENQYNGVQVMG